MDYRKAKVGVMVRVNRDIDQAAQGTEGTIIYLRGFNFDGREKVGRYCQVWVKKTVPPLGKAPERKVEYSINVITTCLDLIKEGKNG